MKKTKESLSDIIARVNTKRQKDRIAGEREAAHKLNEWRAQQVADRTAARIRVFVEKPHEFDKPEEVKNDKEK